VLFLVVLVYTVCNGGVVIFFFKQKTAYDIS